MLRVVLLPVLLLGLMVCSGCGGDPVPTATEPQAPNQMVKTDDEKIDYLIAMLHREDSLKKNAQAARELGKMGAKAERSLPELKKAIAETKDDAVKSDAEAAIAVIEAAVKAAQ